MQDTQRHNEILQRAAEKYHRGLALQKENTARKISTYALLGTGALLAGGYNLVTTWNSVGVVVTWTETFWWVLGALLTFLGTALLKKAHRRLGQLTEGDQLVRVGRYQLQVELAIEAQERYHVTGLSPETISLTTGEHTEATVERDGRKLLVKVGPTSLVGEPLTLFSVGEEL